MTRSKTISVLAAGVVSLLLNPPRAFSAGATLSFSPSSLTTPLNQSFTASVIVDTAGFSTGGVGTIIRYDPFVLSAVAITTNSIFADYPLAAIDKQKGKISISGISSSNYNLFSGKDTFAVIEFVGVNPGKSIVSFDFIPGSTTDSNVAITYGNGDVLGAVSNLSVVVTSTPGELDSSPISQINYLTQLKNNLYGTLALSNLPYFKHKLASVRTGRLPSQNLDPLSPLVSQPPITDPSSSQPTARVSMVALTSPRVLSPLLLVLAAFLVATGTLILYRRSRFA